MQVLHVNTPAVRCDGMAVRSSNSMRLEQENLPTAGKKIAEGFGGMSRALRGVGHAPLQLTTGQRGVRRAKQLWRDHGAGRLQHAKDGITFSFVVKVRIAGVGLDQAVGDLSASE